MAYQAGKLNKAKNVRFAIVFLLSLAFIASFVECSINRLINRNLVVDAKNNFQIANDVKRIIDETFEETEESSDGDETENGNDNGNGGGANNGNGNGNSFTVNISLD